MRLSLVILRIDSVDDALAVVHWTYRFCLFARFGVLAARRFSAPNAQTILLGHLPDRRWKFRHCQVLLAGGALRISVQRQVARIAQGVSADLRKELERRSLDKTGLKQVLIDRRSQCWEQTSFNSIFNKCSSKYISSSTIANCDLLFKFFFNKIYLHLARSPKCALVLQQQVTRSPKCGRPKQCSSTNVQRANGKCGLLFKQVARSPKCPQPHFLQTKLLGRGFY